MSDDYNLLDYMDSFDFSDKKENSKEKPPQTKNNKGDTKDGQKNRDNSANKQNNNNGNQNRNNQPNQKPFNKQNDPKKNSGNETFKKDQGQKDSAATKNKEDKPQIKNTADVNPQSEPVPKEEKKEEVILQKTAGPQESVKDIGADIFTGMPAPVSSEPVEDEMPFKEMKDTPGTKGADTDTDTLPKTEEPEPVIAPKKEEPVMPKEEETALESPTAEDIAKAKESSKKVLAENSALSSEDSEIMQPLPGGYLDGTNIGEKIDEKAAAKIINCSVRELVRITELYNEYLTCTKTEDGHFFYNRYDITMILQILYDQVDGGYSDKDMLAFMKDDDGYKRPFKDNAKEFPEQIRLAVNQAFKGYAYELQTSVTSLINQLSGTISAMNTTIASQKRMLEEQSRTMKDQTDVIMKMAQQLEKDAKALDNIPQIMGDIPKTVNENSEKQSKAISEIVHQMRSGQGETKKAISDLLSEIEKIKEAGHDNESTKKIESLSESLDKITKEQNDKLSEIASTIGSNEKLKEENTTLQEKLETTQKALEQAKSIEEYNSLSENYDKASEQIDELQQQLESANSALELSEAKDQAHAKELNEFREKVGVALKNIAEESDQKSERIRQLESQLKELRNRQGAVPQQRQQTHEQEAPQRQQARPPQKAEDKSRQPERHKSTSGMTSEQRKNIQKQYANDVRKQAKVERQAEPRPNIPPWAVSSQIEEEDIEAEVLKKKEKKGLFGGGGKKQKEPIVEDVELDDDADLTANMQKKKKFGFLR